MQNQPIQINPQELVAALKSAVAPRLIDVRTPEEQGIAVIDGGIPATQESVQVMLATWARDTPIVTYCHHGVRSLDAAKFLIGRGFTNVRSLAGGIEAWAQEVDPTIPRY